MIMDYIKRNSSNRDIGFCVSQLSKLRAQQAGLSRRNIALCKIGGFLHDLGKVGVPDDPAPAPTRFPRARGDRP